MNKTVLMLQNNMNPPGGANTVALWMLEAIKSDFDVTVLTWEAVDYSTINTFYGTSLKPGDFKVITVSAWIRGLMKLLPDPWLWQRFCVLMRKCKRIQHRYDILLSAHDETDFGRPGLQYVHFPFQRDNWVLEQESERAEGWMDKFRYFFAVRLRPWRLISGFSFRRMKQNRTLVNSSWTGRLYRSVYGPGDVRTVYPPIVGDFAPIPWNERESGFVCIGRFAGDKRIDRIIEILSRVRRHHPSIHLHLVGTLSPRDDEGDCYQMVMEAVQRHADWIHLHEDISREDLIALLCGQRYGIHGKLQEHFGLAIAEMLAAGCIPFVPNDGGQVEIVGERKQLLYDCDDEAVENIMAVLENDGLQEDLQKFLLARTNLFSQDSFRQQILQELNSFPLTDQTDG